MFKVGLWRSYVSRVIMAHRMGRSEVPVRKSMRASEGGEAQVQDRRWSSSGENSPSMSKFIAAYGNKRALVPFAMIERPVPYSVSSVHRWVVTWIKALSWRITSKASLRICLLTPRIVGWNWCVKSPPYKIHSRSKSYYHIVSQRIPCQGI